MHFVNKCEAMFSTKRHTTCKCTWITTLFKSMRIMKFKLMITFFAAISHLSGPLRKQNFTSAGSKGHVWDLSLVHVSRFVACDLNDWRQRKTQLWRQLLNLKVRMFVKCVVSAHLKLTSLLVCIAQNVATYQGTLSALRAPNLKRWSANRGQKRGKNGQNCSEWLTFFTFSL